MQLKSFLKKNIKSLLVSFITLFFLILYISLISFSNSCSEDEKIQKKISKECRPKVVVPDSVLISPSIVLDDKNDVHLAYAQAYGMERVFTSNMELEADTAEMLRKETLVYVKDNPLYRVDKLKHSYPYVVPEMADLLNEIAYRFKQQLPDKKKEEFLYLITSALRTNETQLNLSRHNRNAAPVSAHLFGTTVDISYKVFYSLKQDTLVSDFDAVQALTKALQGLRFERRLVSVRERRQACFHTTIAACPPKETANNQ